MLIEPFNRKELPLLAISFLFLCQIFLAVSVEAANTTWTPEQFSLKWGSIDIDSSALAPNEQGKLFFALPITGQQLHDLNVLKFRLDGSSPQKFFVLWQTNIGNDKVLQIELDPPVVGDNSYDLSAHPDWTGTLKTLGLGFNLPPNQKLELIDLTLSTSTLFDALLDRWTNWSGNHTWYAAEINRIIGSRDQDQGILPVPFFAGLTALALIGIFIIHLMRRSKRSFNWQIAGVLVLCIWIASDTFWHMRLWRQAVSTWETFGAKTTQDKLLASDEAALVEFIQTVKSHIPDQNARVFIASASDYIGMNSAYYLSPLNIYWNRGGAELPSGKDLLSGDYILIMPPSRVIYNSEASTLKFPGKPSVKVAPEYRSPAGILLKVI